MTDRVLLILWWSWLLGSASRAQNAMPSEVRTSGESGILCGDSKCVTEASCDANRCVCPNRPGFGSFHCPQPDSNICAIFNDPVTWSFDHKRLESPIPCKVIMTHVQSTTCKANQQGVVETVGTGMCNIRVFTWGQKRLGKFFIGGVEVKIFLMNNMAFFHHATRISASGQGDTTFIFKEEGNRNPFGAPPYDSPIVTTVPGLGEIRTIFDEENNFAVIDISICGITVGVRGVDLSGQGNPRLQIPGVYVTVDNRCDPHFLSEEAVLCAPPMGQGASTEDQISAIEQIVGRAVEPSIFGLIKALASSPFQDFPGASSNLQTLSETVQECGTVSLVPAVELCFFVIHNAKFINCWDNSASGHKVIQALDSCIYSICDGNEDLCMSFKDNITLSDCVEHVPQTGTILQHSCSFP